MSNPRGRTSAQTGRESSSSSRSGRTSHSISIEMHSIEKLAKKKAGWESEDYDLRKLVSKSSSLKQSRNRANCLSPARVRRFWIQGPAGLFLESLVVLASVAWCVIYIAQTYIVPRSGTGFDPPDLAPAPSVNSTLAPSDNSTLAPGTNETLAPGTNNFTNAPVYINATTNATTTAPILPSHLIWSGYPIWLMSADLAFAVFFTLIYILRFYTTESTWRFFRNPMTWIDHVTVIPAYFVWSLNFTGIGFLRVISIVRVLRILTTLRFIKSVFIKALIRLIMTIVVIVFVFASLLLLAEPETFLNWHTAAYFVMVAVTTVGFGDLSAHTDVGRYIVVVLIFTAAVMIPLQVFWLSAAASEEKKRQRGVFFYSPSVLSVLVLLPRGFQASLFRLKTFVQEFFRRYGIADKKIRLVLMAPDVDSDHLEEVLQKLEIPERMYKRVVLIHGEGTFRPDLMNVRADAAAAVVIFNHASTADRDNALTCLAVSALNPKVPVLVPVWSSENESFARATGPSSFVFSTREFRAHLLANSLFTTGLPTLLLNLVRTKSRSQRENKQHTYEYQMGRRIGLHVFPLGPETAGVKLMRLTRRLYREFCGAILIGVVHAEGVVFVPNRKYIVEGTELGIFLREEADAALLTRDKADVEEEDGEDNETLLRRQRQEELSRPSIDQRRGPAPAVAAPQGKPGPRPRFSMDLLSPNQTVQSMAFAALKIADRLPSIELAYDEPDILARYCYVLNKTVNRPNVIRTDTIETYNHFLVIAWGDDCDMLADIVVPLRSRALKSQRDVVFLAERAPSRSVLNLLSSFANVQVVIGNGLRKHDLHRANALSADKALILSPPGSLMNSSSHEGVSHSRDAILCYRLITQINRAIECVVEVTDPESAQLLHRKPQSDPALFREIRQGIFCPTVHLIDTLMASSCDAPVLLSAIQQMALLQSTPNADKVTGCTNISLIDLPRNLIGKTFGDVFKWMCGKKINAVPIGLYRAHRYRAERYVFTSPPPDTPIEDDDEIFIMTVLQVGTRRLEENPLASEPEPEEEE